MKKSASKEILDMLREDRFLAQRQTSNIAPRVDLCKTHASDNGPNSQWVSRGVAPVSSVCFHQQKI